MRLDGIYVDQFRGFRKVGSPFFVGWCHVCLRIPADANPHPGFCFFPERSQVEIDLEGHFDDRTATVWRKPRQKYQRDPPVTVGHQDIYHMSRRFLRSPISKLHDLLTDSASWQIIIKDMKNTHEDVRPPQKKTKTHCHVTLSPFCRSYI